MEKQIKNKGVSKMQDENRIASQEQTKALETVKTDYFKEQREKIPALLEQKTKEIADRLSKTSTQGLNPTEIYLLMKNTELGTGRKTYTVSELEILFDNYTKIMYMVNQKQTYPPTIKNFCAYLGISTTTYEQWLMSSDINRKNIMKEIDDYISDMALSLAQTKKVDNITTMFRAKTEHKMVEAQAPTIIRHEEAVDMSEIREQLKALQGGHSLLEMKQDKNGVYSYEEKEEKK